MADKASKTKDYSFDISFAEAVDHIVQSHSYIPAGESKEILNKTATRMLTELGYDMFLKIQGNKKTIANCSDRLGYEAYKAKQNGTPNDDDPKVEDLQRYMKQAEARLALAELVFEALQPSFVAIHGRKSTAEDWLNIQEERKQYIRKAS